ncbi:NmrA family transcriptional regulator [Streptomyces bambusae]|uniref:NmrA family transcriptional regulator n=1 Tax=Streptomyces bambusae TaxID=1550616 RepID=UPI001CFEFEB4|nr:NmrA family transcriptional regulator [Streptomyces bambusae]MCB5168950.1 NmrA family transcriptional regulator [Streptomyces bambusae]
MTNTTENTRPGTTRPETVLVTTATGKTGRRVAQRLADLGHTVRAGSRTGPVRFDWADETTWGPALAGADRAYVAFHPDLAAPAAAPALREFGRIAAAHGVRRLVVLSGRGEPEAVAAERALGASGAEVTAVRASFFAENFSEGFFVDGILAGELPFPAGEVAEPFILADDLADVLVATLTDRAATGVVHEVTGPQALTFAEAVAEIGRATGRAIRYVPVSGPAYAALLERYGLPAAEAHFLSALFTQLLDGHNSLPADGVKQVLGRDPRPFAAYAAEAAAAGAWS